jgi:hypothetical protein
MNILSSVQIAILIVSSDLRIRRFTPMAERMLNLIGIDVGRPIGHIKPNFDIPTWRQTIARSVDAVTSVEREVQDRHGPLVRAPHPAVQERRQPDRRRGAVAVRHRRAPRRRSSCARCATMRRRWSRRFDSRSSSSTHELRVRTANESFLATAGLRIDVVRGRPFLDLADGEWNGETSGKRSREWPTAAPTIGRRAPRVAGGVRLDPGGGAADRRTVGTAVDHPARLSRRARPRRTMAKPDRQGTTQGAARAAVDDVEANLGRRADERASADELARLPYDARATSAGSSRRRGWRSRSSASGTATCSISASSPTYSSTTWASSSRQPRGGALARPGSLKLVGMPLFAGVVGPDRRRLLDHFRECRASGGLVTIDLELPRRDGGTMPIQLLSKRRRVGDGDGTILCALIDMTETRAGDSRTGGRDEVERSRGASTRATHPSRERSQGPVSGGI